jgi:hypothetical protein
MLETVALPATGPKSYPFQIELRAWFRMAGVLFTFSNRPPGPPNITKAVFAEAVRKMPLARAPSGRHRSVAREPKSAARPPMRGSRCSKPAATLGRAFTLLRS